MRAAGFAEPSWIDKMKEANKLNKRIRVISNIWSKMI